MAGRRGLVVPQNTFLENIIKRANGVHQYFLLASAQVMDAPIVYCSDGFTKLTGYKKNQVMRKKANCSFMYGSLTTKDNVRELRNALQEKTSFQIEILFYKKDGTPFWLIVNIGLIQDELQEIVLFLITFQDISEFKEPINPNYRKHRWSEFNKSLRSKSTPDNPISKAKEEKNRMQIAQLMEDQVDSLPEYKQDIPKTPRFVILHCCTPKIVWDWLILILILYTATSVPFIACFKFDSTHMTVADTVVDFLFLMDVIVNFHTTYVDEDGSFVFDIKKIRRTYLRSWFVADFITSLPYSLLAFAVKSGAARGVTDLISFLKAIRLLRLNRVVRVLDQYMEYGFITLILWMLFFCLCAHWMACIFFAIAVQYDNYADIGWVRALSEATNQPLVVVNGTVREQPTFASLYMSSLYFSLTSLTSIGFGNIAPNTTAEKIFSCITMIFGGLCYAVIFGQVTAIVQQSQRKSEDYHQTLDNMRAFCKLYKVPKEISTRILDYYMYTWTLNKGVDTNQVLQHCPKDLQSDICIHLNRKVIDSNPAFGELSNAVLRAIARNFAIHHVAPGERIIHEGESLDTLFFVASGSFEITQKGKVVGLVGEGDVFGDDVCRTTDIGRSVADVFALTYGDVHAIGRDELLGALSFYPEYGAQFAKVFRLSYNLRDEITMRKISAVHRVKSHNVHNEMETGRIRSGQKLSFAEEMHNNFDGELTPGGLDTPNSQHITDTDPPSKPFAATKGSKPLQGSTMGAISENSELDDLGTDEDWKKWDDYQNRRESRDGLFNEIADMKFKVRHEIEVMGGKMKHLEENVSMILSLLKERDSPTASNCESHLLQARTTPRSASSRTALIVNRAKAEIPEETLPDWVEMENFGMAGDGDADENFAVAEEMKEEKEEEEEEEEEEPAKPAKPAKKASRKNQRKAKREEGEKRKRKRKSKGEEENTSTTPQVAEEEDERESRQELEVEGKEDKREDDGRVTSAKEETSRMSRTKDEDAQEPSAVEETNGRLSKQNQRGPAPDEEERRDDAGDDPRTSRTENNDPSLSHQSVREPEGEDKSAESRSEAETDRNRSSQSRHEPERDGQEGEGVKVPAGRGK